MCVCVLAMKIERGKKRGKERKRRRTKESNIFEREKKNDYFFLG